MRWRIRQVEAFYEYGKERGVLGRGLLIFRASWILLCQSNFDKLVKRSSEAPRWLWR
jgi:hypothetical protein